jgi:hypothetical protein
MRASCALQAAAKEQHAAAPGSMGVARDKVPSKRIRQHVPVAVQPHTAITALICCWLLWLASIAVRAHGLGLAFMQGRRLQARGHGGFQPAQHAMLWPLLSCLSKQPQHSAMADGGPGRCAGRALRV